MRISTQWLLGVLFTVSLGLTSAHSQTSSTYNAPTTWNLNNTNALTQSMIGAKSGIAGLDANGNVLGNFTAPDTGAVARSVQSKLSDVLNVRDFGAKCDGQTDDSGAFLAALSVGQTLSVRLEFSGTCVVTQPLTLTNPQAGLEIDGHNGTLLTGPTGLDFETGSSSTISAHLYLHNFTVQNNTQTVTGTGLKISNANMTSNASVYGYQSPLLDNLRIYGYHTAISINQISQVMITNSITQEYQAANYAGIGLFTTGTSAAFSAGLYVNNTFFNGGTCIQLDGAWQGDIFTQDHCNLAYNGLVITNPISIQNLTVEGSYFDTINMGIDIDNLSYAQIINNNFDIATTPSANWAAISALNANQDIISENLLLGITQAKSPPLRIGGMATVTDNYVAGLTSAPYCMTLTPSLNATYPMVVSNNTCFAASGYNVTVANPLNLRGTGNLYSGANGAVSVQNFGSVGALTSDTLQNTGVAQSQTYQSGVGNHQATHFSLAAYAGVDANNTSALDITLDQNKESSTNALITLYPQSNPPVSLVKGMVLCRYQNTNAAAWSVTGVYQNTNSTYTLTNFQYTTLYTTGNGSNWSPNLSVSPITQGPLLTVVSDPTTVTSMSCSADISLLLDN